MVTTPANKCKRYALDRTSSERGGHSSVLSEQERTLRLIHHRQEDQQGKRLIRHLLSVSTRTADRNINPHPWSSSEYVLQIRMPPTERILAIEVV